ncbi:hypothetical protein GA0070616_2060 [Micromonospora nigra]|uniref:Uncharacterized protein n=1 Tax=Micromonospora nigra TaxID=145857 RepID=A0A1C6RU13_9ACTN|nr:hypothetical protein [Micromonospora nigra]SCL20696.1 hypothetical protein GA0070616_2060 [Micromonospora nigra]
MTTDDDQTEDPPGIPWIPAPGLPGQLPIDRLDFGDAEQLAEMTGADEPPEEPVALVDEAGQVIPPYDRAQKRRNQRPLPT